MIFFLATMIQANENAKSDEAGDPDGIWSSVAIAVICILVGLSTLAVAAYVFFSRRTALEVKRAARYVRKKLRGSEAPASGQSGSSAEASPAFKASVKLTDTVKLFE